MRATDQYKKANHSGIELVATCEGITISEWENFMQGAVKANGLKIRRLIKKHLPDLYFNLCLDFRNPYEHQAKRKDGLFIYVHSAIEYFIKIN